MKYLIVPILIISFSSLFYMYTLESSLTGNAVIDFVIGTSDYLPTMSESEISHLYDVRSLIFKAKIVDTSPGGMIAEVTGPAVKIDGFVNLLPQHLIAGVARTGIVAMEKLAQPWQT